MTVIKQSFSASFEPHNGDDATQDPWPPYIRFYQSLFMHLCNVALQIPKSEAQSK
jgi:hypothetical protein